MDKNKSGRKKTREERKAAKKPIEAISGAYFGKNRFLRVIEQPHGRPGYVSSISNTATNFQLAARYGNIGLVAHNYLGGRIFNDLEIGDEVYLMDGYGRRKRYRVVETLRYQAVNPRSTRSNFINLKNKQLCSASDVFKRVYTGKHHLVLQTCIKKGKNEEWGRIFIIAHPEKQRG
ncbi:MAG: sortase [Anaerolineaceae bacterium]|nr:sortase [Anaerolineaceae bacterium]